jgi:hypothetical protein
MVLLRPLIPRHLPQGRHKQTFHRRPSLFGGVEGVAGRGDLAQPMTECRESITGPVLNERIGRRVGHLHQSGDAVGRVGHGDQIGRFVAQILER